MTIRPLLVVAASMLAAACSLTGPGGCNLVLVSAVRVTVRDAQTHLPPEPASTLVIVDGTYKDSVVSAAGSATQPREMFAGDGRPGTYEILVRTSGYADWTRSGVVVSGDHCGHPNTAKLTADVSRVP
jgi:hypothetical protein